MSQIEDGLINDGKTEHFAISYEETMPPEDGREVAQGLMNVIEADLAVITDWFRGVDFKFSYPINVELHNATGGAGWASPPDWKTWLTFHPTVTLKSMPDADGDPQERGLDYVRHMVVAELAEMFMASKDNGWYEHTTAFTSGNEGSKGEGLSRFLAHQFCLEQGITARFKNSEVVSNWLTSNRGNYVDSAPDDPITFRVIGGTTAFIYYLHDQLGYAIPDIIDAGAPTLAGVYQKLTGRTDAWNAFIGLVTLHYPAEPEGVAPNTLGDNIFPVANLSSLGAGASVVGGSSTDLYITLDRQTQVDVKLALTSDDPATLQITDTLVMAAGRQDEMFTVHALPIFGPPRSITLYAAYAGNTVNASITVTPAASSLTGKVSSANDGTALSATLIVDGPASEGVNAQHWQLQTGADGSYSISDLEPGDYTVEVSASGYETVAFPVSIAEGVPVTERDVALIMLVACEVSGTVTDGSGTALAGVKMSLIRLSNSIAQYIETSPEGYYTFALYASTEDGAYALVAEMDGYVNARVDFPTIDNGDNLTQDIVLLAFGTMTGSVTDDAAVAHVPIAAAQVTAGSVSGTTDASGHYTLSRLAPGPTSISVIAQGFDGALPSVVTVLSGSVTTQDFALVRASATLAATVKNIQDGSPIAGASVNIVGATAGITRTDGTVTIGNIPAGSASVSIKAVGYDGWTTTIEFTAHQTIAQVFGLNETEPPGPGPHR